MNVVRMVSNSLKTANHMNFWFLDYFSLSFWVFDIIFLIFHTWFCIFLIFFLVLFLGRFIIINTGSDSAVSSCAYVHAPLFMLNLLITSIYVFFFNCRVLEVVSASDIRKPPFNIQSMSEFHINFHFQKEILSKLDFTPLTEGANVYSLLVSL